MLLDKKVAIVYGGGGVIGGAVADAFARAGAQVHVAGRAQVDALDERSVQRHADAVAASAGRIDIAFNAVGVVHVQGVPLLDLALEDYFHPVQAYTRTHFITAKAVARHMVRQRSGVILTLATPGGRMAGPGYLGHSVACAGIEALTRHLAGELGEHGVRVVCIRSHAIPETVAKGSHAAQVFGEVAARAGMKVDAMLAGAASGTLLKRLPKLDELANTAVFLASEHAGAMTGAIANLTCGTILD
jgi:3-oxoacyl-[acyl-carrier protein] reductase